MNLSLISSPYMEDTLSAIFKNIDVLNLPFENHTDRDISFVEYYKINLLPRLHDLLLSDMIIVIGDDFLSEQKCSDIIRQCEKTIYIPAESRHNKIKEYKFCSDKPLILLTNAGKCTQIEKVLFELLRVLDSYNIKARVSGSYIYDSFCKSELLSPYTYVDNTADDYHVQIHVADVKYDVIDKELFYLSDLSPDILISCFDADFKEEQNYSQLLKYRHGLNSNLSFYSDYCFCENEITKAVNIKSKLSHDGDKINLNEELRNILLQFLLFPDDIEII